MSRKWNILRLWHGNSNIRQTWSRIVSERASLSLFSRTGVQSLRRRKILCKSSPDTLPEVIALTKSSEGKVTLEKVAAEGLEEAHHDKEEKKTAK